MKSRITFTATIIFFLIVTMHLKAPEKNKLNKSELREKVIDNERGIDSLTKIITVQSSDIASKMSQINSLKNDIQTKDSEIYTLKQTNKSNQKSLKIYISSSQKFGLVNLFPFFK